VERAFAVASGKRREKKAAQLADDRSAAFFATQPG